MVSRHTLSQEQIYTHCLIPLFRASVDPEGRGPEPPPLDLSELESCVDV